MKVITGLTKVRHRNEVGVTLASLSLSAKRVLFLALCQINTRKILKNDDVLEVDASFFSKATALEKSAAYAALKEGAKILSLVTLVLDKEDVENLSSELDISFPGGRTPDRLDLNLTEFCIYYNSLAKVRIKFNSTAKKYFSKLIGSKNRYTTQVLKSVVALNSVNSTNLYQVIRKYYSLNKENSFEISIKKLKDEMGLYDVNGGKKTYRYPKYSFFSRDVIKKSIKEIIEKTEIKNIKFFILERKERIVNVLKFEFSIEN